MQFDLTIFPVVICAFVSYLRNHCLIRCQRYTARFASKNFTVLALTFRSMIHFELIFVYDISKVSKFIFCMNIQFFQPHLLKRLFSPLNYLVSLIKNQFTINVRVHFWALNSIPLIYMSGQYHIVLINYCTCVVSFEIGM